MAIGISCLRESSKANGWSKKSLWKDAAKSLRIKKRVSNLFSVTIRNDPEMNELTKQRAPRGDRSDEHFERWTALLQAKPSDLNSPKRSHHAPPETLRSSPAAESSPDHRTTAGTCTEEEEFRLETSFGNLEQFEKSLKWVRQRRCSSEILNLKRYDWSSSPETGTLAFDLNGK